MRAPVHESIVFLLFCTTQAAAKRAAEAPPASNPLVEAINSMVSSAGGAVLDLGNDAASLIMGVPMFLVGAFVWAVGLVRQIPDLVANVYNADDATLDKMTSFCVYSASVIFVVTASLTALNLTLGVFVGVKDYFSDYLVIPTDVMGLKLPGPVLQARNIIQKELLDRVRNFRVKGWIVPLEGQSGNPSLAGATPVLASAVSACMILSSAPALHSLIKNGADKNAAEALAYTMGTALGVQYLVNKM